VEGSDVASDPNELLFDAAMIVAFSVSFSTLIEVFPARFDGDCVPTEDWVADEVTEKYSAFELFNASTGISVNLFSCSVLLSVSANGDRVSLDTKLGNTTSL
jgi:hypothetical protein